MDKTFAIWHSDAGHEWLEVYKADCIRLGLQEADFSHYSYKAGNTFFLEGDCDAEFFIQAAKKHGLEIVFGSEYHWGDRARIRDYPRLNGESRLFNARMVERHKAKQAVMSPSY